MALVTVVTIAVLLGYGGQLPTVAMLNNRDGNTIARNAAMIEGSPRVIDGDTLELAGHRIRLYGIDAPESGQLCQDATRNAYQCGKVAKDALIEHIGRQTVTCERRDVDRYRRTVAICNLGAEDINGWMVSQGWAVAYRQYALDYLLVEIGARLADRGIWQGQFIAPRDWRSEH